MRPSECVCAESLSKVLPNTLILKERVKNSNSMHRDTFTMNNERHGFFKRTTLFASKVYR